MQTKARKLLYAFIAMRLIYFLLFITFLSGCTNLFFQPDRVLYLEPNRIRLPYQGVHFPTSDGLMLHGWFLPAKEVAKGTVLFLHGNGQNISTHFLNVAWLPAEGFNVLALDYRGYGASEGTPSITGVQLDIDAAMRHLLAHKGVDPNRIVILGQSLGGALAIYYAAHSTYRTNIRAVVIDSAFFDYRQIAREKLASSFITWPFQWLPWLTVNDDYSPADSVAAISPLPLLLIQGDRDAVVPLHHSQQLYERAKEPKERWVVPGAGHIQSLENEDVRKRLLGYLRRHTS
jgi:uncharacterized protein